MSSNPQAVNPIDPPDNYYESIDQLVVFLQAIINEINAALLTIQNRLAAGGL